MSGFLHGFLGSNPSSHVYKANILSIELFPAQMHFCRYSFLVMAESEVWGPIYTEGQMHLVLIGELFQRQMLNHILCYSEFCHYKKHFIQSPYKQRGLF